MRVIKHWKRLHQVGQKYLSRTFFKCKMGYGQIVCLQCYIHTHLCNRTGALTPESDSPSGQISLLCSLDSVKPSVLNVMMNLGGCL